MIQTLDEYISNSLPQWGEFSTNPNLTKKVCPDGSLLPYRGNTVVFLLDAETKDQLQQLQDSLYEAAPDLLAERLQTDTFHMTLHDLVNGTPDQQDLEGRMWAAENRARELLRRWRFEGPLRMQATWLFNMVHTSIVLGLAPADEQTWRQLDALYCAFETVVPLGYGLTPHITMAYFRPGTYDQQQLQRLSAALRKVDLDVTLSGDHLVLQNFSDMNHYTTIP